MGGGRSGSSASELAVGGAARERGAMATPIDDYLERFEGEQLATLLALHRTMRELLPTAEECIKYRMPAYVVAGKTVGGFDGFKQHCSYFPHSGSVIAKAGPLPDWTDPADGTLRFPIGKRLPKPVVKRLVRVRLDEISAVTNGKRVEFFDDGRVKAEGSMKDGRLHGAWRWYRKDGTLLRTGSFRLGEKTGVWETHAR